MKHRYLYIKIIAVLILVTLILLFSLKGDVNLDNPLTIFWIAIPLFIQTILIFVIGYFGFARALKLPYRDAAPAAMIAPLASVSGLS